MKTVKAELQEVYRIAKQLRAEILQAKIPFEGVESFPIGCCGNASDRLKIRLMTHGFKKVEYVWGRRSEKSHGWLEYEGYIIDITADQFPEKAKEPIIIVRKEDSDFHKQFWQTE